jgi:thiosulfate/3-mercaptopyruvate sulfurtransferase
MLRLSAVPLSFLSIALLAQTASDPWKDPDLMQPSALAARLTASEPKPAIWYVGFPVLYRSAHISGAELAGPASKPEGLERLKQMAAKLPRDQELVIYCGCCPWDQCPNVRPAFRALHEMGFTRLKLVTIPTNLSTDWVKKGYSTERAAEPKSKQE